MKTRNIFFLLPFLVFIMLNPGAILLGSLPVPSLPGGLCFPSFTSSGLVNSAALSHDWRSEAKLLYSPPLTDEQAHSYSSLAGYSNGMLGINLGYLGSYQSDSPLHGGFVGGSFKIKKVAFGYTASKLNLENENIKHDISMLWAPGYYSRFGLSLYGVGDDPQVAFGMGWGRPQRNTIGLDILFPMNPKGRGLTDQYSLTLTVGNYFENWGYSGGINFSRQQDGFQNPDQLSGQLSLTKLLKKNMGGILQFRTHPQALMVSLVWLSVPSSSQYISKFKGVNRKTIWRD